MKKAVFLLIAIGIWQSFSLYQSILGGNREITSPIARIEFLAGTVKVLSVSELLWERVRVGANLALGETVATGENSRARIVFQDGGSLELEPNTMIVIRGTLAKLELDFLMAEGIVRVSRKVAERIKIPITPRVQVVEEEKIVPAVAVERLETPKVSEETVKTASNPMWVKRNEVLSLYDLPEEPMVLAPGSGAIVDLTNPKLTSTRLQWKTDSKTVSSYELVIKPSNADAKPKTIRLSRSEFPVKTLKHGEYEWAVRAIASNGMKSPLTEYRRFSVLQPAKISQPIALPVKIE